MVSGTDKSGVIFSQACISSKVKGSRYRNRKRKETERRKIGAKEAVTNPWIAF